MNKSTLLLAGLLASLTACATQSIRVPVLVPAPVNLVQYDLVAVDRFQGEGCEQFSDQLADALQRAVNPMTGKPGFQVLHRKVIDRAVEDFRDRRGDDSSDRTIALLEQWRKAPIVLKGAVQRHDVEDRLVEERGKDPKGNVVVCQQRQCTACVRVCLEATDVEGRRVFDSTVLTGTASATSGGAGRSPVAIDHQQLLAAARSQVVQCYLDRVLPHKEWVAVELYKDSAFPDLEVGNGFAEIGNWNAALESYQRALQAMDGTATDQRPKALYNLGVAYEFTDRFDEAKKTLEEAYAAGRDQMVLCELQRVSARADQVRRLREQGAAAAPAR